MRTGSCGSVRSEHNEVADNHAQDHHQADHRGQQFHGGPLSSGRADFGGERSVLSYTTVWHVSKTEAPPFLHNFSAPGPARRAIPAPRHCPRDCTRAKASGGLVRRSECEASEERRGLRAARGVQ